MKSIRQDAERYGLEMKMKRIIKILGTVATLASLMLVFLELIKMDIDESILSGRNLIVFGIYIIIYTGLIFILGTPWGMYVKTITGEKIKTSKLYLVFTRSNLMKYIPGNILQYVGRNEIAVEYGLKHKDVVCATVMDVISLSFSGFLVAILFSFKQIYYFTLQYIDTTTIGLIVVCIVILLLVFLVLVKKVAFFSFLFDKKMILKLFTGIGLLIVFHTCSAGMFFATLTEVLGVELHGISYAQIIGAWCVGYLIGYVVPGSPGGLGVREAVIAMLLSYSVDVPVVAMGTVFMRIANIIGEVLAFLIAYLINGRILLKKKDD